MELEPILNILSVVFLGWMIYLFVSIQGDIKAIRQHLEKSD